MPNTPMKEGYHEKAELSFTLFVGGKVLLSALILFTEGTSTTEEGTLESSWIFFGFFPRHVVYCALAGLIFPWCRFIVLSRDYFLFFYIYLDCFFMYYC
jgi:hypothetical protein